MKKLALISCLALSSYGFADEYGFGEPPFNPQDQETAFSIIKEKTDYLLYLLETADYREYDKLNDKILTKESFCQNLVPVAKEAMTYQDCLSQYDAFFNKAQPKLQALKTEKEALLLSQQQEEERRIQEEQLALESKKIAEEKKIAAEKEGQEKIKNLYATPEILNMIKQHPKDKVIATKAAVCASRFRASIELDAMFQFALIGNEASQKLGIATAQSMAISVLYSDTQTPLILYKKEASRLNKEAVLYTKGGLSIEGLKPYADYLGKQIKECTSFQTNVINKKTNLINGFAYTDEGKLFFDEFTKSLNK